MPAVLVEMGFITNPAAGKAARSPRSSRTSWCRRSSTASCASATRAAPRSPRCSRTRADASPMRRRAVLVAALAVARACRVWLIVPGRRLDDRQPARRRAPPPPPRRPPSGRSSATLFYVSEDGLSLVGVERDVPFGATPSPNRRAPSSRRSLRRRRRRSRSAIPAGTTLRGALRHRATGTRSSISAATPTTKHLGGGPRRAASRSTPSSTPSP